MYNEDRKLKFIQDTKESNSYGISIFSTTAIVEEQLDMDLCILPADAIQSIFDKHFGVRKKSLLNVVSFIMSYYAWCKDKGFEIGDGIYNVNIDSKEKIKMMMVSSPKHLDIVLNKLFDDVELETIDCLYRSVFWLAFSGMEDLADILEVTIDEIDLAELIVRHNGKRYELPRESIRSIRNSCELDEFTYIHPNYSKEIKRKRRDNRYLFRAIKAEKINVNTFKSSVGKIIAKNDIKLTIRNVFLSGVFFRAYENQRSGFNPDFSSIAMEKLLKGRRKFDANHQAVGILAGIERELYEDYERWKDAFS